MGTITETITPFIVSQNRTSSSYVQLHVIVMLFLEFTPNLLETVGEIYPTSTCLYVSLMKETQNNNSTNSHPSEYSACCAHLDFIEIHSCKFGLNSLKTVGVGRIVYIFIKLEIFYLLRTLLFLH